MVPNTDESNTWIVTEEAQRAKDFVVDEVLKEQFGGAVPDEAGRVKMFNRGLISVTNDHHAKQVATTWTYGPALARSNA